MALPLAEMSSIIFEVSGIISILCFMTNFASTESIDAPVSGKDLNVDNVLLLIFTLRLIRGVGDPGKSADAIGIDTEFLPFVVVLTDAALALNFNFCLFLLMTKQYRQLQQLDHLLSSPSRILPFFLPMSGR